MDLLYVVINVLGRMVAVSADGRIVPIVSGAAEGDAPIVPEDLSSLTEDQIRELHGQLEARFTEVRGQENQSRDTIEQLRQIRATQARLVEQLGSIAAEAADIQNGLAEVDAPITLPDPAAPATPVGEPAGQAPAAQAPAGDPAGQTQPQGDLVGAQAAATPGGLVAGLTAAGVAPGAGQTPAAQAAAASAAPARPRQGYTAGASQHVMPAGTEVDYEQIGRMVDSVKTIAAGPDGSNVRAFVAALPAFEEFGSAFPTLSRHATATQNDAAIREAVEDWRIRTGRGVDRNPQGRTAAICAPLDIIREVPDCSTDRDPFGDSLPQRPAGRLGFQFTPAIALSAVDGGVQAGWNDTNQAAVDPTDRATWKPCVDIECPTPTSTTAEAVTACVTFDTTTEMSNPERVQDVMKKLAALRVRRRTIRLLTIADTLSSHYTFASQFGYGAFPALIEAAMATIARAVYAERIEQGDYNIYLPPGLVETLVTDLVGVAFNDADARRQAAADVLQSIRDITGLTTIQLLDEVTGNPFAALRTPGQSAVALPRLNQLADLSDVRSFPIRFIAPEAALYYSTGEERTGIESSPELMRQNKRQWFSEEFVGLAKHGCHPWFRVDVTLCPNGARTGFNTPVACTDPTP